MIREDDDLERVHDELNKSDDKNSDIELRRKWVGTS